MIGAARLATRGFTLVELLVGLAIMALLSLLSWRGLDGMARVQASTRQRAEGLSALQNGLDQWRADLDAVMETAQLEAVDFDGRVLRITRRDAGAEGSPWRVVGWTRLPLAQGGFSGQWARWQSLPLRTGTELRHAWAQAQRWSQNLGDAAGERGVAIVGLEQWQVYFYRNGAWSNPLSTASKAATAAGTAATSRAPEAIAPVPDGIRLVLTLSAGQSLGGTLVKDWVRPTLGGDKS
ncbi:MAG: ral secretion pathway protein [Polaromonas sp.]|nr:ral secretion pathway protein [Polaromonas sp.]